MKSIVIAKPRELSIVERPMPEPKLGETLLEMRTGGICGSDLGIYRGTMAYGAYPRIPGHEFSAEVVKINGETRGFSVGELVTANPYFNCTRCYSCRRGFVNCCTDNQTMGVQRDGAFSEYFVMPTERLISGKGLSPDTLALIEPFCISYHGVCRANIQPGERVLVIGAGTIGILALFAAKALGAQVYVCDVSKEKLEKAIELGADGVLLNENAQAFHAGIQQITGGDGFDVTIEAVGLPSTFQNAIDAAAYRARMVLLGISQKRLDFDFTVIQKKELAIMGSRNAFTDDFEMLITMVQTKKIDLERIVSNRYPLLDAGQAFEAFDIQQASLLKVLIQF